MTEWLLYKSPSFPNLDFALRYVECFRSGSWTLDVQQGKIFLTFDSQGHNSQVVSHPGTSTYTGRNMPSSGNGIKCRPPSPVSSTLTPDRSKAGTIRSSQPLPCYSCYKAFSSAGVLFSLWANTKLPAPFWVSIAIMPLFQQFKMVSISAREYLWSLAMLVLFCWMQTLPLDGNAWDLAIAPSITSVMPLLAQAHAVIAPPTGGNRSTHNALWRAEAKLSSWPFLWNGD